MKAFAVALAATRVVITRATVFVVEVAQPLLGSCDRVVEQGSRGSRGGYPLAALGSTRLVLEKKIRPLLSDERFGKAGPCPPPPSLSFRLFFFLWVVKFFLSFVSEKHAQYIYICCLFALLARGCGRHGRRCSSHSLGGPPSHDRRHGRLERRGCRSTPRRMGAAEAARQAAGIAAAKRCFRPRFTTTFVIIAAELYLAFLYSL